MLPGIGQVDWRGIKLKRPLAKGLFVAKDVIEPSTRRPSRIYVIDLIYIYQSVTEASVALSACLHITMYNSRTQNIRVVFVQENARHAPVA